MNQVKPVTYISIVTAIVLWGFSFIWTNQLLILDIPIFTFITIRMLLAGIILFIISKLLGKLQKVDKKDLPLLILMVFFEPFIYFIGESWGMKYTNSPTVSAVIIATIPLFTLVSGRVFYKEKMSGLNISGIILTIPGILLMVMNNQKISVDYWFGILLLFVAVIGAVGYSTSVKWLTGKYNSYTIATYQFLIGGLMFLPCYLIFDASKMPLVALFNKDVLIPLLSLAILCSCLAFVLYINSIKALGISKASVFSTLIPAVSAFGAYLAGHETFTTIQIAGIAIVILGVIFAQYNGKRK